MYAVKVILLHRNTVTHNWKTKTVISQMPHMQQKMQQLHHITINSVMKNHDQKL